MPAAALLSGLIEHSLNHWLQLSTQQANVPQSIIDRQFAIHITDLKLKLNFQANQQGYVSVLTNHEHYHCLLTTNLSTLGKLQETSKITALIKTGDLDLDGDVHLAQHFADWLKTSINHWQDALASVVGDIACYKISHAGESAVNTVKAKLINDRSIIQHWLTDEKKLAPHALEMDLFSQQINQVRQDTDRLAAKTQQLFNKLKT